ncbi:MAG TPA: SDR family oxidoreductase [Burkholderiales bacterium]|nr:SDR family oxidoreductase [Burkholderiales bacterium]
MSELTGKVAVITGCASPQGIGYAVAGRFASAGASLLLVDTGSSEPMRARCAELRARPGVDAPIEPALFDLAESGAAEAMVERALERFGRVDILVNNAGLRVNKRFGEYTRSDFERSVAVNVAAPLFASQAVLPAMRKQGGGRIIFTASQLGTVSAPTRAVYGLTKAALIHLTKSMALELAADNIIVNAISPGPVRTQPIIDRDTADPAAARERIRQYMPGGRYGEPDEIADLALFLATTRATYLQGENIVIDGGYTAH